MNKYPSYPTGFLHANLENCRTKTSCEGGCEHHEDGLQVVRVEDRTNIRGHDWGYYAYCPAAIKEDKRRGLSIIREDEEGFLP